MCGKGYWPLTWGPCYCSSWQRDGMSSFSCLEEKSKSCSCLCQSLKCDFFTFRFSSYSVIKVFSFPSTLTERVVGFGGFLFVCLFVYFLNTWDFFLRCEQHLVDKNLKLISFPHHLEPCCGWTWTTAEISVLRITKDKNVLGNKWSKQATEVYFSSLVL